MSPIFTFMDNCGPKGYTIVMSDLAASIFYELERIKHAFTVSCHQILEAFFWPACITLDPRLQKHMSYMNAVFTFIQIEACRKHVHVKIIFITHCVVK